jgi:hypothetical protein
VIRYALEYLKHPDWSVREGDRVPEGVQAMRRIMALVPAYVKKSYVADQQDLAAVTEEDVNKIRYHVEKATYLVPALGDVTHALYLYERCQQGTLPDLKTHYVPLLGDVEHILYLWKQDLEHKLADPGLAECDREKYAQYILTLDQCLSTATQDGATS